MNIKCECFITIKTHQVKKIYTFYVSLKLFFSDEDIILSIMVFMSVHLTWPTLYVKKWQVKKKKSVITIIISVHELYVIIRRVQLSV